MASNILALVPPLDWLSVLLAAPALRETWYAYKQPNRLQGIPAFLVRLTIAELPFHAAALWAGAAWKMLSSSTSSLLPRTLFLLMAALAVYPLVGMLRLQAQSRSALFAQLPSSPFVSRPLSLFKAAAALVPIPALLARNMVSAPSVVEVARVVVRKGFHASLPEGLSFDTVELAEEVAGSDRSRGGKHTMPIQLHIFWNKEAQERRKRGEPASNSSSSPAAGVTAASAAAAARHGAPVLFYIHGGAWIMDSGRYGSKPFMLEAARQGFIICCTNYRLAQKAPFPHMLTDIKVALGWIKYNIGRFGGDPGFVIAAGESAGGHLALLTALTPGVAQYEGQVAAVLERNGGKKAGSGPLDLSVQGVVDLYGPADWTDHNKVFLSRGGKGKGLTAFIGKLVLQRSYSDHTHEFVRGSPQWWLQGRALGAALSRAGIKVEGGAEKSALGQIGPDKEMVVDGPAAAHALVKGRTEKAQQQQQQSVEEAPLSPLIADMAVDRPIPPILVVHGDNDTVVPFQESQIFWQQLQERRQRDKEKSQGSSSNKTLPLPDCFLTVPGGHHAFNFLLSPRTFAVGDAVTQWMVALHAAAKGQ